MKHKTHPFCMSIVLTWKYVNNYYAEQTVPYRSFATARSTVAGGFLGILRVKNRIPISKRRLLSPWRHTAGNMAGTAILNTAHPALHMLMDSAIIQPVRFIMPNSILTEY